MASPPPTRRSGRRITGALLALLVWGPVLAARTAAAAADCALSCPGVMGPGGPIGCFDFTTTKASGDCGETHNNVDGTGPPLKVLRCGGLDVGGGASMEAEGPTPDGATSRLCVEACNGNTCTLGPSTASGPTFDCSAPGCLFGPPLPISSVGTSTCVVRTWSGPGGGTLDVASGSTSNLSVPLAAQIYLTGDALHPCPLCKQGTGAPTDPICAGTPDSPCSGVCELPSATGVNRGGPNEGLPCTSTNSQGLSKDCPPGGVQLPDKPCNPDVLTEQQCIFGTNLGTLAIALDPLTTGTATTSDPDGVFCPHQDPSDLEPGQLNAVPGCFESSPSDDLTHLCRRITVRGSPAGSLLPPGTVKAMTLAAIFCIPRTGSLLLDLSAALPGPGALTLPVDAVLVAPETATTTTTSTIVPTTTTVPTGCADAASFDSLLCRIDLLASLASRGGLAKALLRLAGKASRQLEQAETRAADGDVRGARRKLGAARRRLRVLVHRVRSRAARRAIPAPLRDELAQLAAAIRVDVRALAGSL
jgi:hypothetical protein